MDRRDFLKCCGTALLLSPVPVVARDRRVGGLFVMDTWFWRAPELGTAAEAALLNELGFDGMALSWGQQHEARLESLRSQGLQVPGCYIVASIDNGYPEHLRECVNFLKGTGAWVWLGLTSAQFQKSDPAGDSTAFEILTKCADQAKKAGLPGVALYPHVGFWMEKVRDSLRLADKADRADIGLQFNQYHWMVEEEREDLWPLLQSVKGHLKGVSLNGSDPHSPSILPLHEGDYDVSPLLSALNDLNYDGPISHQGYSIEGNLPERLSAAKAEWEKLKKKARGFR